MYKLITHKGDTDGNNNNLRYMCTVYNKNLLVLDIAPVGHGQDSPGQGWLQIDL